MQIGINEALYYVNENSGSVHICTSVLSGRIAGRSFSGVFRTVDGVAVGTSSVRGLAYNFANLTFYLPVHSS